LRVELRVELGRGPRSGRGCAKKRISSCEGAL
jgi:hypothetical protein